MGSRANFVLVEDGKAQLFYSNGEACAIPAMMMAGPAAIAHFMRQLEPDYRFLSWGWADGGILLDCDQHYTLFWGGSSLNVRPFLRRAFLPLLAPHWPGWRVEWSRNGQDDLQAAYFAYRPLEFPLTQNWPGWRVEWSRNGQGDLQAEYLVYHLREVPPLEAKSEPFMPPPPPMTQAQVLQSLVSDENASWSGEVETIITIRWPSGDVSDFLFYHPLSYRIILLGLQLPGLLSRDAARPLLCEAEKPVVEPDLALLDTVSRTVWVGTPEVCSATFLAEVHRAFPGWSVSGHNLGLAHHAALSGRDPALYRIPDEQARQLLIQELLEEGVDEIVAAMPLSTAQGIRLAPGSSRRRRPPLRRRATKHLRTQP